MIFHFDSGDIVVKNPTSYTIKTGTRTNSRRALSGKLWSYHNERYDEITFNFDNVIRESGLAVATRLYEQLRQSPTFYIDVPQNGSKYPSFKGKVWFDSKNITVNSNKWRANMSLSFKVLEYETF